jgi:hypothetical protein
LLRGGKVIVEGLSIQRYCDMKTCMTGELFANAMMGCPCDY